MYQRRPPVLGVVSSSSRRAASVAERRRRRCPGAPPWRRRRRRRRSRKHARAPGARNLRGDLRLAEVGRLAHARGMRVAAHRLVGEEEKREAGADGERASSIRSHSRSRRARTSSVASSATPTSVPAAEDADAFSCTGAGLLLLLLPPPALLLPPAEEETEGCRPPRGVAPRDVEGGRGRAPKAVARAVVGGAGASANAPHRAVAVAAAAAARSCHHRTLHARAMPQSLSGGYATGYFDFV